MLNILATESLKNVARRLVWFKKPEDALNDPYLFLAHVMTFGTVMDVITVKQSLGLQAFREALDHLPPGIIDPKSWTYWNLITGIYPAPPLPTRNVS